MVVCLVNLHPWFSYDLISLSPTTTFSRCVVSFQQGEHGYQEQINLLLIASALFLASLYRDSKEKVAVSCVGRCDFSVSQEYVGVWGANVCWRWWDSGTCVALQRSETWAFKWFCSRQGHCFNTKKKGTNWATLHGGMREISSGSSVLCCRVISCHCSSPRLC